MKFSSGLFSGALGGNNLYTSGDPDNSYDPLHNDMLTGNFSGAFVGAGPNPVNGGPNVAAGVIGNFDFVGPGVVSAVGTVAGVRDALPLP